MHRLFLLPGSLTRDPAVDAWLNAHGDGLGSVARHWFNVMRDCGDEVRELMHDGCPTACFGEAAFAYVGAFRAHVSVGFFGGAELPDPAGLLEGTGKYMRHVKLRLDRDVDTKALASLIERAYAVTKERVEHG